MIAIIIPSYKREKKLNNCITSIQKAIKKTKENIIIKVFFDNNYKCKVPNYIDTFVMFKQYKAFGIWNYFINRFHFYDAIIYLCDDVEVKENSLKNIVDTFYSNYKDTDGIVTFNQSNLSSASKYAMGLIGRKFINRFNKVEYKVFCPDYSSFYADTELGKYAESLNKFTFCKEAEIIHYHPSVYKEMKDETHEIVRKDNVAIKDKTIYKLRKEKGYLWGKNFNLINK